MKRLLIPAIAIMILALASCTKPMPAVDTVGEQNKALVKKYMDAVVSGDTAAIGGFLADNFMARGPSLLDSANKQQEITNWGKNWKNEFSAMKYEPAESLAITLKPEASANNAGDWVLNWGTVSADYKDGRPSVKFIIHLAMKVTNGKVDTSIAYYNVADILTQQGFTFVPPAKEAAKK